MAIGLPDPALDSALESRALQAHHVDPSFAILLASLNLGTLFLGLIYKYFGEGGIRTGLEFMPGEYLDFKVRSVLDELLSVLDNQGDARRFVFGAPGAEPRSLRRRRDILTKASSIFQLVKNLNEEKALENRVFFLHPESEIQVTSDELQKWLHHIKLRVSERAKLRLKDGAQPEVTRVELDAVDVPTSEDEVLLGWASDILTRLSVVMETIPDNLHVDLIIPSLEESDDTVALLTLKRLLGSDKQKRKDEMETLQNSLSNGVDHIEAGLEKTLQPWIKSLLEYMEKHLSKLETESEEEMVKDEKRDARSLAAVFDYLLASGSGDEGKPKLEIKRIEPSQPEVQKKKGAGTGYTVDKWLRLTYDLVPVAMDILSTYKEHRYDLDSRGDCLSLALCRGIGRWKHGNQLTATLAPFLSLLLEWGYWGSYSGESHVEHVKGLRDAWVGKSCSLSPHLSACPDDTRTRTRTRTRTNSPTSTTALPELEKGPAYENADADREREPVLEYQRAQLRARPSRPHPHIPLHNTIWGKNIGEGDGFQGLGSKPPQDERAPTRETFRRREGTEGSHAQNEHEHELEPVRRKDERAKPFNGLESASQVRSRSNSLLFFPSFFSFHQNEGGIEETTPMPTETESLTTTIPSQNPLAESASRYKFGLRRGLPSGNVNALGEGKDRPQSTVLHKPEWLSAPPKKFQPETFII